MGSKAQPAADEDTFRDSRVFFEGLITDLEERRAGSAGVTEASTVKLLLVRGLELMRLVLQAWLNLEFQLERVALTQVKRRPGVEVRARRRGRETPFGTVSAWRLGWKEAGRAVRFPLDERMAFTDQKYCLVLRELVSQEARRGSWDGAVEHIDRETAGHVPKRQAQELALRSVKDFDEFQNQRKPPPQKPDANRVLGLSGDAKGVRMIENGLRPPTRDAAIAAREEEGDGKGDPMAPKKARHKKRMATVTAVWTQERHQRTAADIMAGLEKPRTAEEHEARRARMRETPRPRDKTLSASLERTERQASVDLLAEADRRDPNRTQETVMLIDGCEHQENAIRSEAVKNGRQLTLVLDIIHALSYLWKAGFAICRKDRDKTESWTRVFFEKLLTEPVATVILELELAAKKLPRGQRAPVEACIKYFSRRKDMMRYPEFIKRGLPIATGIIEGACRHLIQDRLGITGARWDVPGADAILKLRALHSNGQWDDYWEFHASQESERTYAEAA